MGPNKNGKRKDMNDLKNGIVDTAITSKEIVQDKFRDVKTGTKNAVNKVDAHLQNSKEKTQNTAGNIKKGSLDVAHSVKETAVNVAQTVTSSSIKDK